MRQLNWARLTIGIVAMMIGPAHAITVDFEDVTSTFGYTELESNGYRFSADCCFEVASEGSPGNFLQMTFPKDLLMEESTGSAFALSSLDIFSYPQSMLITGSLVGGGIIQTSVNLSSLSWSTINFDASWQNLQSVTFDIGTPTRLDNIIVSTVPIPAAVWLFGSALAGLSWIRRKQTS